MWFVLNWVSQPYSVVPGETAMMPAFSVDVIISRRDSLTANSRAQAYIEEREVRLQWI
jgi:hypothetical protein